VRFDPSGTRLAESSSNSIYVQVWDLTNQAPNILAHRGPVTAIAWHPDGRQLATASDNHDVYLWDLRFSKKREIVRAHSATVIDMAFSPQGDMLASMGADMALKLWSPATAGRWRIMWRANFRDVCISAEMVFI
jgi:WD40 repeat protein